MNLNMTQKPDQPEIWEHQKSETSIWSDQQTTKISLQILKSRKHTLKNHLDLKVCNFFILDLILKANNQRVLVALKFEYKKNKRYLPSQSGGGDQRKVDLWISKFLWAFDVIGWSIFNILISCLVITIFFFVNFCKIA